MSHFILNTITFSNSLQWKILKANIDFDDEIYIKAITQAKQKSRYTMDASQRGVYRSPELKYQMQLMGIISEIYAQQYFVDLITAYNNLSAKWRVIRYDDVRTDGFRSPANEYDLKIQSLDGTKNFKIESRSSIARDRSIKNAIEHFDIIGPYSSTVKIAEDYSDFFIRPLYEFIPFASKKYLPSNFETHLKADEIKLYIVAGCTNKEMYKRGYNKDMNQEGTRYRVVRIIDGYDVKAFIPIILERLKQSSI